MIKNYDSMFRYIYNRQQGICLRALDDSSQMPNKWYSQRFLTRTATRFLSTASPEEIAQARMTELHHRCHKAKWKLKKLPLFINSMLNLAGYCKYNHEKERSSLKILDMRAERYEVFLQHHPRMAKFVNGGF